MKTDDRRLERLFAAARENPPDTSRVEEGFEERLAARVRTVRREEKEALLGVWAWRLAPWFAGVALTVGVWTAMTAPVPGLGTDAELAAAWDAVELADSLGGG